MAPRFSFLEIFCYEVFVKQKKKEKINKKTLDYLLLSGQHVTAACSEALASAH